MEARIAKPGKTLAISYNWVANFNWVDEINTESIGKLKKTYLLQNTIYLKREKILLLNMEK